MMKKIRTVLGDIEPRELGYTSMHEHTLIKQSTLIKSLVLGGFDMAKGINGYKRGADLEEESKRRQEVLQIELPHMDIKNVLLSMKFPKSNPASKLTDLEYYTKELGYFYEEGGRTVCDCSPVGMGRKLKEIQELSRKSSVNIICCAGYYTKPTIPKKLVKKGITAMEDHVCRIVEEGDGSCDARPGFIKCAISTLDGERLCQEEEMGVVSCARAALKYGMSLHIHTAFPIRNIHVVKLAEKLENEVKINPAKVIFCHMDSYNLGHGNPVARVGKHGYDAEFPKRLLRMGFNIGLDTWSIGGVENTDGLRRQFDIQARYGMLMELISEGYTEQITLGHDFMTKTNGVQNKGMGYTLYPRFLREESEKDEELREAVKVITVNNPMKILTHD